MSEESLAQRESSLSALSTLIKSIDGKKKVTLIGDTMLDRFHHGFANNLNSTAPVPVLKITRTEESAGASAHIAIGLCSFGMNVSFYTCVGDDPDGQSIIQCLDEAGVNIGDIEVLGNISTLTKIRFFGSRESLLDREQILLQADKGPNEDLPQDISQRLTANAKKSLKDSCALIISDYDKGVVSFDGAQSLIDYANKSGIPSIVDPKLTGLEKSRGATVVIFERRGLALLARRLNSENHEEAAKLLIDDYSWDGMLVLGGIDGLYLYQKGEDAVHYPCMAPTAEQQIGMHDAAAASLAASLGSGFSLYDAALLAAASCECVLSASTSEEYIDRNTLSLWLDELSWQMRISDR